MSRKQVVLLAVAVALLGGYAYFFSDWFASETIQIAHNIRPYTPPRRPRGRGADENPAANTVSFSFMRKCRLTEVKVIPVSDLATNKYAHPIWHLVSESNSVPTKAFVYGMNIDGMHPKIAGARPDPLEPGVAYRLIVQANDLKGEHEFKTTPRIGSPK